MSFITNSYPGACECGKWVAKGQGKMQAPERRGGRWSVGCFECMDVEEQTEYRRRAEQLTRMQQQHAARSA